jgi:hypothetical protein
MPSAAMMPNRTNRDRMEGIMDVILACPGLV